MIKNLMKFRRKLLTLFIYCHGKFCFVTIKTINDIYCYIIFEINYKVRKVNNDLKIRILKSCY